MSTITAQIQLRRDTSANWTSNNPILLAGEMALSTDVLYSGTDQPRYKIGNGVDTWLNLDYVPEGSASQGYTLLFTAGANLLISPADATTYYFGSGRNSIYTPDHAVIIPKAGTLKSISFFHVVNSTLGTAENSTLSVQVRNTGYSGSVSTTTQITNTYKFNSTYNSTMFTGLNIDLPEGCAVDIKWLTPTWVTNPAQIQINATLFIV
jgi:hypothetical protein